jgi:hypothetical protein
MSDIKLSARDNSHNKIIKHVQHKNFQQHIKQSKPLAPQKVIAGKELNQLIIYLYNKIQNNYQYPQMAAS